MALGDLSGHVRQALQGDVGQGAREHRERRTPLRARSAPAVPGLPDPHAVHRAGRPDGHLSQREGEYKGDKFQTCSNGCQWIFEREPEKYVQAWLPVHQIYQGNCGGPTVPDVLAWYGIQEGDGGEHLGSVGDRTGKNWHAGSATGKESDMAVKSIAPTTSHHGHVRAFTETTSSSTCGFQGNPWFCAAACYRAPQRPCAGVTSGRRWSCPGPGRTRASTLGPRTPGACTASRCLPTTASLEDAASCARDVIGMRSPRRLIAAGPCHHHTRRAAMTSSKITVEPLGP